MFYISFRTGLLYGGEVTIKSMELCGISFIIVKQSPQIILFKYLF